MAKSTTGRPKLEVCLESLMECATQLDRASKLYQQVNGALQTAHADPEQIATTELGLQLVIGGLAVPVPMPSEQGQRLAYIEEAVNFLGEDVIRLWNRVYEIGNEAVNHCNAAARAAAQQQAPPAQAPQPAPPPA